MNIFSVFYRLNDMARKHWAHVRDYTESLEKDRMNLVRRIEVNFYNYNYNDIFYPLYIEPISSAYSANHHSA